MRIQSIRLGANPQLDVEIYDGDTNAVVNLTGYTIISASAKDTVTGTKVSFTAAAIKNMPGSDGKINLTYATNTFAAAGTYSIDILVTDTAGKSDNFPYEGATLLLKVWPAN